MEVNGDLTFLDVFYTKNIARSRPPDIVVWATDPMVVNLIANPEVATVCQHKVANIHAV